MAANARLRVHTVSVAAAGAALLLVTPVRAQDPPPDPGSAVDQYVEQVPTASGPAAPGIAKKKRSPLPRAGANALKKASPKTAKALEEIATSSDYGAPQVTSRPKPRPTTGTAGKKPDAVTTTSVSATLRSSVGALGTASDSRLIGLLAVLLVSAAAAVAIAVRRT